jgi:hypothetical protein
MTATDPIEQIRSDYLARYGTPVAERIEVGPVRDFLLAMDEPANLDKGVPAFDQRHSDR